MNYPRWSYCYVCHKQGIACLASIRIFSGIGGGGYAACGQHEEQAATDALEPLGDPRTHKDYSVTAYTIDWVDGRPKMGRRLWEATARNAT